MNIGAWMLLVGGVLGVVLEGARRNWLGGAVWACALVAGALRIAPVPPPITDSIYFVLGVAFLVLSIVRVVKRR